MVAQGDGLVYTASMGDESADRNAGRAALWTFLGMALGFKLVTSVVIFWFDPTFASATFLFWMNWYWPILPVLLLILPAMFWYRLWRVRARRRDLIRSEWRVDPELDWIPTPARGTIRKQ